MNDDIPKTRKNQKRILNDFWAMPTVLSQMPLQHSRESKACLETLTGCCVQCDRQSTDNEFRGTIRQPVAGHYKISGWAYCRPCNLLSPIGVEIRETDTFFEIKNHPFYRPGIDEDGEQVVSLRRPS